MRALAAVISLFLATAPALAASPRVDAAVTVFQAVGTDANRLKTFCEMMKIDEQMGEKEAPALKAKINKFAWAARTLGGCCRRRRRKLTRRKSVELGTRST